MAARWVRRGPKPGMRLLALYVLWGGVFIVVFGCALGIFVIKRGGEALGLVQPPPPPSAASVAPDLSSQSHSRQSKAFRELSKLTPDREQREVAVALTQVAKR